MKKMKTAAAIVLAVMMLMGAAGCDEVSDAANSIVTEATTTRLSAHSFPIPAGDILSEPETVPMTTATGSLIMSRRMWTLWNLQGTASTAIRR